MEKIHDGRKLKVFSRVKIPKPYPEETGKAYLYIIRIGPPENRKFKIGKACNILQRMIQHAGYYGESIYVLWVSPIYTAWTVLRLEFEHKERWISENIWEYVKNDRFIIPEEIREIEIKVRKKYLVLLE